MSYVNGHQSDHQSAGLRCPVALMNCFVEFHPSDGYNGCVRCGCGCGVALFEDSGLWASGWKRLQSLVRHNVVVIYVLDIMCYCYWGMCLLCLLLTMTCAHAYPLRFDSSHISLICGYRDAQGPMGCCGVGGHQPDHQALGLECLEASLNCSLSFIHPIGTRKACAA